MFASVGVVLGQGLDHGAGMARCQCANELDGVEIDEFFVGG